MKTYLCINFMSMSSPTDFIRTNYVFKINHMLMFSLAEDKFSGMLFLGHFSPYTFHPQITPQIAHIGPALCEQGKHLGLQPLAEDGAGHAGAREWQRLKVKIARN